MFLSHLLQFILGYFLFVKYDSDSFDMIRNRLFSANCFINLALQIQLSFYSYNVTQKILFSFPIYTIDILNDCLNIIYCTEKETNGYT